MRFFKTNDYSKSGFELETFVLPIQIEILTLPVIGKEVTLNIKSQIKNEEKFFTDSCGLDMLERKLNFRPTWPVELKEKAAGNYYPLTSTIYLQDAKGEDKMMYNIVILITEMSVKSDNRSSAGSHFSWARRNRNYDSQKIGIR